MPDGRVMKGWWKRRSGAEEPWQGAGTGQEGAPKADGRMRWQQGSPAWKSLEALAGGEGLSAA